MSATAQTNGRAPRVPLAIAEPAAAPGATGYGVAPESTPMLDAALLRIQAAAPKFARNADGQIGGRSYKYVTLDALLDVVLPLLVAEGLLWKTKPTMLEDGRPGLRYSMTHVESGEKDEDAMELLLGKQDMQAFGSANTYARRYALVDYLNLTVDPDDDGAGASGTVRTINPPAPGPGPAAAAPSQRPQSSGTRPVSVAQGKMLWAKVTAAGLSKSQFADALLVASGHPARSMGEEVAERWLKQGIERFPANKVDAAIKLIEGGA